MNKNKALEEKCRICGPKREGMKHLMRNCKRLNETKKCEKRIMIDNRRKKIWIEKVLTAWFWINKRGM